MLRDRLAEWAAAVLPVVDGAYPDMPAGIVDRPADLWEPLLAVADAASGAWPTRARVSAVTLVTHSIGGQPSLGVRLLGDLRTVFGDSDVMFSEDILTALNALDEAPWSDLRGRPLNPRGLAQRLRTYGVTSKTVRIGDTTAKGYTREDLHDPWSRYLSNVSLDETSRGGEEQESTPVGSPPEESVTSVTSDTPHRASPDGKADHEHDRTLVTVLHAFPRAQVIDEPDPRYASTAQLARAKGLP